MTKLLVGHCSLVSGQSSYSSGGTVTAEARRAPGLGPPLCSGDCERRQRLLWMVEVRGGILGGGQGPWTEPGRTHRIWERGEVRLTQGGEQYGRSSREGTERRCPGERGGGT